MFEEMTYEKLLQTCMERAPEGIDTRKGSIFYDACADKCLLLAEVYADLDTVSETCHIDSAVGDNLDSFGADHGVTRLPATCMRCRGVFVGATPPIGSRFFASGIFFVLKDNLNELYPDDTTLLAGGNLYLEAEIAGTEANTVSTGDILTPYNDIEGLESATVGEVIVSGDDVEEDESYRERIQNKVSGPAENGNKYHYKAWCEECQGVGKARIFTLAKITNDVITWHTPNWVTGILLKDSGRTVEDATVGIVQEYIDPDMEGLGEGVANVGAHFMAVKAKELALGISIAVELSDTSYTLADAKANILLLVTEYLKELALSDINFNDCVADNITIRIKQIGSKISSAETIADYDNLQINIDGGAYQNTNISISPHCVAYITADNITVTEIVNAAEE